MKRTSTALLASVLLTPSSSRARQSRRAARKASAISSPSQPLSSSLPSHEQKTTASSSSIFACGTSLSSAIAGLSPNSTLCPSGLDSDCPANQYCYAGLSSKRDGATALNRQLLERQAEMERSILNASIRERQQGHREEMETRFVCGASWERAVESVCDNDDASSNASLSSSTYSRQEPIYCPTGEAACPSDMACYASVSCSFSRSSSAISNSSSKRTQADSNSREKEVSIAKQEIAQNLSSTMTSNSQDEAIAVSWYSTLLDSRLGWNGLLSFGSS
ncbi:hypothetical protein ACHAWO_009756 [Cyclotella atomus]|uniref:Uncharacterized protein n=1 Tax=Cyclotella atomus TaxID=382360 RepID=A0ABD3P7G0_9STRA